MKIINNWDVRRGGCERRMTKLFELGGDLKGLTKGEWSKGQFVNMYMLFIFINLKIINITFQTKSYLLLSGVHINFEIHTPPPS